MDRNEKYWIKNARERYKFMSKSDFHTTTAIKLQVRVLVFSVLNAGELHVIRGLMRARNLKKQCMYKENMILKTPLMIYFNFFPKVFPQNLSCQTAAYRQGQLIRQCLR